MVLPPMLKAPAVALNVKPAALKPTMSKKGSSLAVPSKKIPVPEVGAASPIQFSMVDQLLSTALPPSHVLCAKEGAITPIIAVVAAMDAWMRLFPQIEFRKPLVDAKFNAVCFSCFADMSSPRQEWNS